MNAVAQFGLLLVIGPLAMATTVAQEPDPQSTNPAAASSPHQRDVTGNSAAEIQVTPQSRPDAAASPHQQQVTGLVTADPATFVKTAAQGGMTEVALGKIAMSKGGSASVRAFGERMVKDHSKANAELAGIAKGKGLDVPSELDAQHQMVVDKLDAKGADFDAAYAKQMMADHDKTIALFEGVMNASDADLAAFAKKTLPTVKEHKRLAHALPQS